MCELKVFDASGRDATENNVHTKDIVYIARS